MSFISRREGEKPSEKEGWMNSMKRSIKFGVAICLLVAATAIAGATLITYFAQVNTTLHVTQAVTIDGHDWQTPIIEEFTAAGGDTTYSTTTHSITNNGQQNVVLTWAITGTPDVEGISVTVVDPVSHNPINLNPLTHGATVSFIFKYTLDELVAAGDYSISAKLVPST